jgi:hypothetical protein
MKAQAFALVCAIAVSACSASAGDALPPLATTEKATLAYANCVDTAAGKLAARPDQAAILARNAVGSCRDLRAKALALKSVPVMFESIAEFDAIHLHLARLSIESARAK